MRANPPDAVLAARRRFFDEGSLPEGMIAAPILRSWQRCADHGLAVSERPLIEPIAPGDLRVRQEGQERLRRLTRPEMDSLRAEAKLTDSVVILTDAQGLVLDMVGSVGFADRAARVALRPGAVWNERTSGTNAIGTALVEGRALSVHGPEHFFEPHTILTCAASPILDPAGRLAGILDISGQARGRHHYALGLVRFAVAQIEHRFFEQGFERCFVLRFHSEAELLGTAQEAIMAFEGDRLVAANRQALHLTGLDQAAVGRASLASLFRKTEPSRDPGLILGQDGGRFVGRLSPPLGRSASKAAPARRPLARPAPAEVEPVLSAETRAAMTRAVKLLAADVPLLVQGETGVGKEVFARQVHAASDRCDKPFLAVNCAALPEGLIESELFGYEEGAFTGARARGHKGLLRQAEGGVLFLDEIGDMPLLLQARLLRVLQNREVLPLGGGRPVPVDFTLICATHRPMDELVAAGAFRQDLYFRIAQYVIELPALRVHGDRLGLVRDLWRRLGGEFSGCCLSEEAELILAAYHWPGNYRQLAGTLRVLLALAEPGRPVEAAALPAGLRRPLAAPDPAEKTEASPKQMDALKKEAMLAALEHAQGNVSRAARSLGIDRTTLYRRLLWEKRNDPG